MSKQLRTNYFTIKQKSAKEILAILAMIVLLGISVQFFSSCILTTVLNLMPSVAEEYMNNLSAILEITPRMLLQVCLIAPIIEELFFRGLIFSLMSKLLPFIFANVVQAIVFGIYHGNVVQVVYAFILGMFIGYILFITGSIVYTIVLHMSINLTGMFIDRIVPMDEALIVRMVIMIISFVIIYLLVKNIYKLGIRNSQVQNSEK